MAREFLRGRFVPKGDIQRDEINTLRICEVREDGSHAQQVGKALGMSGLFDLHVSWFPRPTCAWVMAKIVADWSKVHGQGNGEGPKRR